MSRRKKRKKKPTQFNPSEDADPWLSEDLIDYEIRLFIRDEEYLGYLLDKHRDTAFSLISQDLENLGKLPAGSHIGQLEISSMKQYLPELYLTRYTYEFLFRLRALLLYLGNGYSPIGDWTPPVASWILVRMLVGLEHADDLDLFERSPDMNRPVQSVFSYEFYPAPDSDLAFDHWFEIPSRKAKMAAAEDDKVQEVDDCPLDEDDLPF